MGFFDQIMKTIQYGSLVDPDVDKGIGQPLKGWANRNIADKVLPDAGLPAVPDNAPPPSLIAPTAIATDSDKKQAQRRQQAASLSRKGRSSTILSDDTLGSA